MFNLDQPHWIFDRSQPGEELITHDGKITRSTKYTAMFDIIIKAVKKIGGSVK